MKNLKWLLLTLTFFIKIPIAHSETIKFLFFYPGGQGNQELAQPILNIFGEELKKASGDQFEFKMTYLSNLKEGIEFIQTQKPSVVLLTFDQFEQNRNEWKVIPIVQSLQLPSGNGYEQFFILGNKDQTLPATPPWKLLTSSSVSLPFFQQKLFPGLKPYPTQLQLTKNVIGELRNIGTGQKKGFILVNDFELGNLKKLKSEWAKNLIPLATSEKTPSSLVISFPATLSTEQSNKITEALLKIGHQASSRAVLSELRLKGFKKI
jgi:hypothetical protein